MYESADGLPLIGKVPGASGIYFATGYAGNGMTFGTLVAMLLADHIRGLNNPWSNLYKPERFKLTGVQEFVSKNLDVAWHFVADRMTSDSKDLADIPANAGRIMRINGQQLAVYRDGQGELYAFSPVCPHAKCIVTWNTAEQTWDCPCHGGRFDAYGHVLNGPPVSNLEPRKLG